MVAATPIGARVATPKLTDVELYAWIAQAEAGARIEYHRGFLGIDVTPVISTLPEPERRQLADLGQAALGAFEKGLVHLVQERVGPDRFIPLGPDPLDELRELVLVPVDPLRKFGDHSDRTVGEAHGPGILAGLVARLRRPVAVLQRDGPIEPVAQTLRVAERRIGVSLQARELQRRQRRDVADGHVPERVERDGVGNGHAHLPHAAGLGVVSAVLARSCVRSYVSTSSSRYTKRSTLNPESEWHIVEVPELRIVDQDLWDAVKARQAAQTKRRSKVATTDRNRLSSGQTLRRRKYLLSGLLHCGLCGGRMTVAGAGKYKTYYCADAKEKGPSVCTGFRGLRESVALPLVLSALRADLMKPEAYARFRDRVHHQLKAEQGTAEDTLRLHDARVRQLEVEQRNLVALAKQGLGSESLVAELQKIDADLARLAATRDDIVPPDIELPEGLPELYQEMVGNLAASLSEESVVGRAADELHELIDRIDVDWDDEAKAHRLTIEGNLLEMLRKSAPEDLGAVRGSAIFAEFGCGSRI